MSCLNYINKEAINDGRIKPFPRVARKLKTKNVMPKIYNNLGCYPCAKSISWKMIDLKRIKAILNYKINE